MTETLEGSGRATPPLLNRESAILEFNRRVLAQAQRDDVPLLERLRYVCIVSSNLDEFFEVRFAGTPSRSSAAWHQRRRCRHRGGLADVQGLIDEQYFGLQRQGHAGARRQRHPHRQPRRPQRRRAALGRALLRDRCAASAPLLVPVGLDPAHPFPQVANKSLNFIARLAGKDAFGRRNIVAIVKVPRVLPRVIKLPGEGTDQAFVLLTSVIRAHLGELFPGREVEAFSQFRITRDSDLEVDADVSNLRQPCAWG